MEKIGPNIGEAGHAAPGRSHYRHRKRMGDRNIDIMHVCMRVCLYAWMDASVCMCAYEGLW